MNYTTEQSGDTIKVELNGRFTFGDHSGFRKLIDEIRSQSAEVQILDLSGVEFIDSAGLGMLLLARDEGEKIPYHRHSERCTGTGQTHA